MMNTTTTRGRLIAVLLAAGCAVPALAAGPDLTKLPPASDKKGLTYTKDVKPLLEASCFRCHSGEKPKGGLHLDSLDGVIKGGKDGKVIVPGKSKESLLVVAVARIDEDSAMPPKFKPGRGGPGGPPGGGPGGGGGNPPGSGGPGPNAGAGGPPSGGPRGDFGPPPKPLTAEQVGIVRAWVDQGAK